MLKENKKLILVTGMVTLLPLFAGLLLWSKLFCHLSNPVTTEQFVLAPDQKNKAVSFLCLPKSYPSPEAQVTCHVLHQAAASQRRDCSGTLPVPNF